ncbi:MAG: phosphotransferase [Alphaproteobacteria bacterium]|nr:phosphotransferase [Alphaproteobacteria bacterium]
MSERDIALAKFLEKNNWADGDKKLLAHDASFRHYDRIVRGDESVVLMDAPPPMEDIRPFITVDKKLRELGLSAPYMYDYDEENGFILLEDFGDSTYTKLINAGTEEYDLYALATDVLVHLNQFDDKISVPQGLPKYDTEALLKEAMLFPEWYMPAVFGHKTDEKAMDEYRNLWIKAFDSIKDVSKSMVLRDYHVDNLMILNNKPEGLKECGLLDFQDALHGPMIYDIMSLMEDARRDIDAKLITEMQFRYRDGLKHAGFADKAGTLDEFNTVWKILAAGRHAKVLGIFVRLCVRDHKPKYLCHIQRLWHLLDRALSDPALKDLRVWFDKNVPDEYRITPKC